MSAAKDQDWFCDGVAEEILNALSQLKGVRVAARASAFSFRGKGRRPESDRRKASGRHGSRRQRAPVRRSGAHHGAPLRCHERVSVVVGALRPQPERHLRRAGGDRQSRRRASLIGTLIDDSAAQPQVVRHTENQEAYHLYLRGRHLWYSRSKGSLQRARELFEEASRKDPNYVLPWVGLADLFAIQSLYGFEREEYANPRERWTPSTARSPSTTGRRRPPCAWVLVVVLRGLRPAGGGRGL